MAERVMADGDGEAAAGGKPPAEPTRARGAYGQARPGVSECGMRGDHVRPGMRLEQSRLESPPRPYGGWRCDALDVGGTVARGREGVRNTSGITWMSPPGATGGSGEARGVPHLGPAPLE